MQTRDEFSCARVKDRNVRVARWAGRQMGFSGAWLDAYVEEVVTADYESPGYEDVVRKVAGDFQAHGVNLGSADVRDWIVRNGG